MNREQFNSHWGLRKFFNRKTLDHVDGQIIFVWVAPTQHTWECFIDVFKFIPALYQYCTYCVTVFLKIQECIQYYQLSIMISLWVWLLFHSGWLQKSTRFTAIEFYHASMVLLSTNRPPQKMLNSHGFTLSTKNRSYVRKVDRQYIYS